jgi:glycosyltransferase involved in cell wall biosynthesis
MSMVPHIVWNVRCSNLQHISPMTAGSLKLCTWLSHWPSAVIVNSEAGRAFHSALGYRPRRWLVIPNGFDLNRFGPDEAARVSVRAELGLCSDVVLIGLIGRYDLAKDHETFLRAAMHLGKDNRDVHFLLAGYGVEPTNADLCRLLHGHAIDRSVHLMGERTDIPRLMAALDITTSSSYSEGFSNVIGEAMACEVPCVVTDVGDAALIVGNTGIVVPARDPQAMAQAWGRLIDAGEETRREMGRAARRRIEQHYSLERIVRSYEDLYLSLGSA